MDIVTVVRFVLALVVVVGLIAGFAWLMRKYGNGRLLQAGARGRIGIVEVTGLDARRRLVLVRRDGVEHLLVLGPAGETVVETGIVRQDTAVTRAQPAAAPVASAPAGVTQAVQP